MVLRLDFRRPEGSWEDRDRNRLMRLCGLGGDKKLLPEASCWASLWPRPSSSSWPSASETELAVAEYGILIRSVTRPWVAVGRDTLSWPSEFTDPGVAAAAGVAV